MADDHSRVVHLSAEVPAMSMGDDSEREDFELGSDDRGQGAEDDSDDEESMVTLGFVQAVEEPWKIGRQHFPCKVGGTPAWLDPINIPEGESTQCGICGYPLGFLMQVYAPIGTDDVGYREEVFHRSLFLFVCPDMACLQQDQHHQLKKSPDKPCRSVKVFRSQLPRTNRFYDYDPPSRDSSPATEAVPVCTWCGTWKATSVCGGCKQARYCSRVHQLAHWRGGHSSFCRVVQAELASDRHESDLRSEQNSEDSTTNAARTTVQGAISRVTDSPPNSGIVNAVNDKIWPEMELIVGEEEDSMPTDVSSTSRNPQQLLQDYESRRENNGEEFTATDMEDVEESSREQQHWAAFQARLAGAPDQVLRYCRAQGTKPLWPSLEGQPRQSDIIPCVNCGGPRIFEFQLLPQLLYFLQVQNETENDSLDWATIAVYSCAASCNKSDSTCGGYVEEFAWVQLAVS